MLDKIANPQVSFQYTSDLSIASLLPLSKAIAVGPIEETRDESAKILEITPQFSLERFIRRPPFRDPAVRERFHEFLCKAGLK